jgi:hypothetical protein
MRSSNRGDGDMSKVLTTERVATVTDLGRARSSVALAGRDGERLIEWLREAFLLHSDDRPVVIFLRHVTPGRRLGDKLGTIQLKVLAPDQRNAEAAPEVAHALWAKAENYASGLGGATQQFGVHAFYEDNPGESESGTFFWIKVGQSTDTAIDSMPANETGVLRLVMGKLDRFEDNFCDLMTGSVTMMQCMREQIRDMHEQALLDRKERRENEETVRQAKLAEIDREAQREASKSDREMKRELGETVKTVGLAIARKWGGLDVRDVTSPGSKQLMTVFESLSQDEGRFMDLLSRLSPVERTNFMEWWQGQIAALEQVKAGGVTSAAAAAAAATPPAPATPPPAAPPAAASTPAEQAAVAETQAQQWAAVAAALKADAAAQAATAQPAEPVVAPVVAPAVEPTPEPPAPKPARKAKKE